MLYALLVCYQLCTSITFVNMQGCYDAVNGFRSQGVVAFCINTRTGEIYNGKQRYSPAPVYKGD